MEALAQEFKAKVAEAFGDRHRTQYPPELRELARKYIVRADKAGVSHRDIAKALGIEVSTVHAWRKSAPHRPLRKRVRRKAKMKPVILVPAHAPTKVAPVVHGPAGLRVEGLDMPALAELLRALA